jgi:hypothetical protein
MNNREISILVVFQELSKISGFHKPFTLTGPNPDKSYNLKKINPDIVIKLKIRRDSLNKENVIFNFPQNAYLVK